MSLSWSKGEGALILIAFTDSLLSFSSSAVNSITVNWQEYDMTPEGTLLFRSEHPTNLYFGANESQLILEMSSSTLFRNAVGNITVVYDGSGGLGGYGGPVSQFSRMFTPSDLVPYFNHFNDPEHFQLSNIEISKNSTYLVYITRPQYSIPNEHAVELRDIQISHLTLTNIEDV